MLKNLPVVNIQFHGNKYKYHSFPQSKLAARVAAPHGDAHPPLRPARGIVAGVAVGRLGGGIPPPPRPVRDVAVGGGPLPEGHRVAGTGSVALFVALRLLFLLFLQFPVSPTFTYKIWSWWILLTVQTNSGTLTTWFRFYLILVCRGTSYWEKPLPNTSIRRHLVRRVLFRWRNA